MLGTYQKHGIHILYPENWKLEDSGSGEVPFEIWLESPEGAMLSMTFFAPESNIEDVLKEYIAEFQEEYEDLELTPAEDEIMGFTGRGNDSLFYCLDFLVTCKLRLYATPKYLVAILEQAEAREFDKIGQVFLAIKTKMLEGLQ